MQTHITHRIITMSLLCIAAMGCTEEPNEATPLSDAETCTQATAHVNSCLDMQIEQAPTCSAQDARALLAQSCEDIARQSAGGKGDLMCNPIFFWTKCNRGIDLNFFACLKDGECDWSDGRLTEDNCFEYQIKDDQGNVVFKETTRDGNHLMTEDLEDGDYTIEVLGRDGTAVEYMARPIATYSGSGFPENMEPEFTITNGRSNKNTLDLMMTRDNASEAFQCGTLNASVQLYCDGEVYQDDRGNWDWYATITPTSEGAWVRDERDFDAQPFVLSSGDQARIKEQYESTMSLDVWRKSVRVNLLAAGTYDMTFYYIEHDGSTFNAQAGYFEEDAFKAFARRSGYKRGYSVTHSVEVDVSEFGRAFGTFTRELDVAYEGMCPR